MRSALRLARYLVARCIYVCVKSVIRVASGFRCVGKQSVSLEHFSLKLEVCNLHGFSCGMVTVGRQKTPEEDQCVPKEMYGRTDR